MKGYTYDVLDIARYIIERCNRQERSISNLKLQKILYFVQAEFLVSTGHPCFDEDFEAWSFGPVIPKVYHRYKVYGAGSIPVSEYKTQNLLITQSDQEIMNRMIDECSKYSATLLVNVTHRQAPWRQAYKKNGRNNIITKISIKKYFGDD